VFKWELDSRFDKERHDEVLDYARALFANAAKSSLLTNWHHTCQTRESFYRHGENLSATSEDLAKVGVNLCKVAVDLKLSKIMGNKLSLHVFNSRQSEWDLSNALNRWFTYHEQVTRRRILQHKVEKTAIINGMSGILAIPEFDYEREKMIEAVGQKLSPQNMFFDPLEEDDKRTFFIVREVGAAAQYDQKFSALLKKHDAHEFARGPQISMTWGHFYTGTAQSMLGAVNGGQVEIVRIWVKDFTKEDKKYYYTDSPEAAEAMKEADMELLYIMQEGLLPLEGERHSDHYNRHMEQYEAIKQDPMVDKVQLANLEIHINATADLFNNGDQQPDDIREELKFKNGWRYIKIIGDQIVYDGSSPLKRRPVPIALFRNCINDEMSIGISDMDALMNLNRDFNSMILDKLERSRKYSFPREFVHVSFDPETDKNGEPTKINDTNELACYKFQQPPTGSPDMEQLLSMYMSFIELIGGANSTVQGEVPQTRTSGIGIAQLQSQAVQRFLTTQDLFTDDGWTEYAEMLDPYAYLKIMRVPIGADFEQAEAQALLSMSQVARTLFNLPPDLVHKTIASEPNAGAVSRIAGKMYREWEANQQAQQYQAEMVKQEMNPQPQGQGANIK
jgi:hypothetical protein